MGLSDKLEWENMDKRVLELGNAEQEDVAGRPCPQLKEEKMWSGLGGEQ